MDDKQKDEDVIITVSDEASTPTAPREDVKKTGSKDTQGASKKKENASGKPEESKEAVKEKSSKEEVDGVKTTKEESEPEGSTAIEIDDGQEKDDSIVVYDEGEKDKSSDIVIDKGEEEEEHKSPFDEEASFKGENFSLETSMIKGDDDKKRGERGRFYLEASNKTLDKLEKSHWNPKPQDIKTQSFDPDADGKFFREQYLEDKAHTIIASPKTTRVPLIYSGFYAEISAFTTNDSITMARHLNSDDKDFLTRVQIEMRMIYDHVVWTSKPSVKDVETGHKGGSKPSFVEFLESVSLKDWPVLHYGVFNSTYPGKNTYPLVCRSCNKEFDWSEYNSEIGFLPAELGITGHDVQAIMRDKNDKIINEIESVKLYKRYKLEKILPQRKISVTHMMPSLKDYLDTVTALVNDNVEEKIIQNISFPLDAETAVAGIPLFIKKIALPLFKDEDNGKTVVSYKEFTEKGMIHDIVSKLNKDDLRKLFEGDLLKKFIRTKSLSFELSGVKCPHCGSEISRVPLDLREIFFMKGLEERDNILSILM